jgi:hypothetical protein
MFPAGKVFAVEELFPVGGLGVTRMDYEENGKGYDEKE